MGSLFEIVNIIIKEGGRLECKRKYIFKKVGLQLIVENKRGASINARSG